MINSFFRQRAFSLIELLVVVLVIVMLTTVVSLNVGTGGRGIKRARRGPSAGRNHGLRPVRSGVVRNGLWVTVRANLDAQCASVHGSLA